MDFGSWCKGGPDRKVAEGFRQAAFAYFSYYLPVFALTTTQILVASSSVQSLTDILRDKRVRLFVGLAGFFVANAIIAEFMGVKLFSAERSLGLEPFSLTLFGQEGLAFNLSAGVLLWPFVFVLTDLINEYFGRRGVRFLSWLTVVLIAYGFLMYYLAIRLVPADFFPTMHLDALPEAERAAAARQVGDYNVAYALVFGQGLWIIVGSLVAFLLAQLIDVFVFQQIKKRTGEAQLWLRATGSTFVSQLVDSFVVLFIAFYLSGQLGFVMICALAVVAYLYKVVMAVLLTPLIYLAHHGIDRYLGEVVSLELRRNALGSGERPFDS